MSEELAVGTRIDHEKYGEGIVSRVGVTSYEIVFLNASGEMSFSKTTELEVLETPEDAVAGAGGFDVREMEQMLMAVLDKYGAFQEVVPLGEKWHGGTMLLQPADTSLKPKEVPIEGFFHKIVMLRDRLRVLEQNINSSDKLSDEDKVNLQQYITRIYGSLTTFNILFGEKEHYFKGAGK